MELTDEQIETLIENSDGHWREDTFRIDGPSLTALLRAAAQAASADVDGEAITLLRCVLAYDGDPEFGAVMNKIRDFLNSCDNSPRND